MKSLFSSALPTLNQNERENVVKENKNRISEEKIGGSRVEIHKTNKNNL